MNGEMPHTGRSSRINDPTYGKIFRLENSILNIQTIGKFHLS